MTSRSFQAHFFPPAGNFRAWNECEEPSMNDVDPFNAAAALVRPLDAAAMASAVELHGRLTKPAGALGALEDLGVLLSGISGDGPRQR